jgi:hypothetical protein
MEAVKRVFLRVSEGQARVSVQNRDNSAGLEETPSDISACVFSGADL